MFKANLIENKSYYALKRKQLLLFFLPSLPLMFIASFFQIPIWLTLLCIALYILIVVISARNQKRINLVLGNQRLEIDETEIRVKSKKGVLQEVFKLNEVEKLMVKEEYSMPQETMKDVKKEFVGKAQHNYLIIQQNKQNKQLDFEIDSYYMIKQLNKLIAQWTTKGYNIERIRSL